MNWQSFVAGAPEMAAFAQEQFARSGMALIGTIRGDGTPRISCEDACILDTELYLGMMWQSRKAMDLLRDPRIVVHNAICTDNGNEREVILRGRARDIRALGVRQRYIAAVAERTAWREPHFHLFALDIEHAALVEYGGSEQSVTLWPQGRAIKRPYG